MLKLLILACFYMFRESNYRESTMALINTIDLNKLNQVQTQQQDLNTSSSTPKSSSVNVPVGQKQKYEELCKKLNVSKEQLEILLKEYPDFILEVELQQKRVDEKFNAPPKGEFDNLIARISSTNSKDADARKEIAKVFFNTDLSEDKIKILQTELAKNEYLKSNNSNAIEDWNKLSPDEQKKLIDAQYDKVINIVTKDTSVDYNAEKLFVEILAADYLNVSYDEFSKVINNKDSDLYNHYNNTIIEMAIDGNESLLNANIFKVK